MVSVVQKLGPPKIKRRIKDYFALYRSRKPMVKRLTAKSIKYAMAQLDKGKSTTEVALEIGVTSRHVRRLWAVFHTTGTPHIPQRSGRPVRSPSLEEVQLVLDEYR